MVDDVLLNKVAIIERCLSRVDEEYRGREAELRTNFTIQDAIVLNVLRACEAAIDLAMHVCRTHRLGAPQSSRDAFDILNQADLLSAPVATRMKAMVGFRNIAIHHYRQMDLDILRSIIEERLGDFRSYAAELLDPNKERTK